MFTVGRFALNQPEKIYKGDTMSKSTDWLPSSREGILAMADTWLSVCLGKKTAWNIPDAAMEELITLRKATETALETAKNEDHPHPRGHRPMQRSL
jgi:hypothetical protein